MIHIAMLIVSAVVIFWALVFVFWFICAVLPWMLLFLLWIVMLPFVMLKEAWNPKKPSC